MKKVIFLVVFLVAGLAFGQHGDDAFCDRGSDNSTWAYQYKKAVDLDDEIAMVVDKLLSDSDYLRINPEITSAEDLELFGNPPCTAVCTFRVGIVYDKRQGLVLDLQKHPELEDLLYEFTAENIDRIDLNEYHENDIYKHAADTRSGIVLYTSDKDLKKKIRTALRDIAKAEKRAEREGDDPNEEEMDEEDQGLEN